MGGWACATVLTNNSPATVWKNCAPLTGPRRSRHSNGANGSGRRLEELHRSGQPVRYEKEYIRKDGTRVPIELLVHLVKNAGGKPEYYYSFLTDITGRKRAEEALTSQRKELQVILESVPAMIFYKDKENHFVRTNKAFEDAMGRPKEKIQGQSLFNLYPHHASAPARPHGRLGNIM